jgi:hypothetical protein
MRKFLRFRLRRRWLLPLLVYCRVPGHVTVMLLQPRMWEATGVTGMVGDIGATASPGLGTADTMPDTSARDTGETGMAGTELGMPGWDTEEVRVSMRR